MKKCYGEFLTHIKYKVEFLGFKGTISLCKDSFASNRGENTQNEFSLLKKIANSFVLMVLKRYYPD